MLPSLSEAGTGQEHCRCIQGTVCGGRLLLAASDGRVRLVAHPVFMPLHAPFATLSNREKCGAKKRCDTTDESAGTTRATQSQK